MIRFKKYQNTNSTSKNFGQWYARAIHEMMSFDEFIQHLARHHCSFSEATIRGVLVEMETCLRELLLEGKAVRFDDLGIFRIGLKTNGENSSEQFTVNSIRGVRLNLHLGSRFRASDLLKDATFREADLYIGNGNYHPDDEDDSSSATTEP